MSDDLGIDEIVNKIKRRLEQVDELMDSLIVTASVQEYAEKQLVLPLIKCGRLPTAAQLSDRLSSIQ